MVILGTNVGPGDKARPRGKQMAKRGFSGSFLVHISKNLALQVSASNMSEASFRKLISGGK